MNRSYYSSAKKRTYTDPLFLSLSSKMIEDTNQVLDDRKLLNHFSRCVSLAFVLDSLHKLIFQVPTALTFLSLSFFFLLCSDWFRGSGDVCFGVGFMNQELLCLLYLIIELPRGRKRYGF